MVKQLLPSRAFRYALIIAFGSVLCCQGQTVLHRWDFSEGPGKWFAAHSCAPMEVNDGRLTVRVTGFDPYIYSSRDREFAIRANSSTFIRMTARCNVSLPAEFFWAEIQEGRDTGFRARKEVSFRMHGDGQLHQYNIFPGWSGQITRIRFDPPGGADEGTVVEISSIELLQLPPAPGVSDSTWDFSGTLAGFVPSQYVEGFRFERDGVVLRGFGPAATLVNETLDLKAEECPWLSLDAFSTEPTVLTVMWRTGGEDAYSKERARVRVPPGRPIHNLRLDRFDSWKGRITGLRIQWAADEEPVELKFRQVGLGATPAGPARLEIVSAGTDRYLVSADEPVRFTVRVRNAGGETLEPQVLQLKGAGLPTEGHSLRTPRLEPAAEAEASTSLTVAGERLELLAPGAGPPRIVKVTVAPRLAADATALRGVFVTDSCVKIGTDKVRLRAPAHKDLQKYGPLVVEVRREGEWRRVGVLPACGALATEANAYRELPWGKATVVERDGAKPALVFTAVYEDTNGVCWTSAAEYRLVEEADRIAMTHTLKCDGEGSLYRYDGPVLRVGDGTFGRKKYEALFPGLEYLSAHEESSSDRDILPPGDLRTIPDPRRICIPAMAIASPEHDVVALLWDNEQKWLRENDQPSAVFASPNLIESGDPRLGPADFTVERSGNNHLMGLFAPSIPDFLEENELRAREPVSLGPSDAITLRSVLLVRADAEVLDAVSEWLEWAKPDPIGDPPKSLREHYALSVRAFEEILYTDGKGWTGVKGWDPSPNPGTALAYLYLAEQLQRPELRQTAVERIGGHRDVQLALHIGSVSGAVQGARRGGFAALGRREADGNWVFRPTEKTASLGEAGDTNVGMAAASVRQILLCAAQSADPALLEEGLKGLEWMRQWRVPRGAQVWEIPLHAPDILASGHCCSAFLWGYRLTGDESYLDDAVYWARTGVPFVYFWQTPIEGLEPMRGGTIPIFGATFYVGSWFGRLVQWCGLDYAAALLELAEYDDSHDWTTIARDITVSGWRQQQEKEGFQGLYPDSWSMLTGDISWGLMLGPLRLVENQLDLDGYYPNGDVRLFRRGDAHVSLLGPGEFEKVSAGVPGDGTRITDLPDGPFDLEFKHHFRNDPNCYVALVGVTEPRTVEVGGAPLQRVADLDSVQQGWTWVRSMPGLVVRLHSRTKERVSVRVSGVNVRAAATGRTEWTFETDSEGWIADHDLAPFEIREGALVCRPMGGDPYLNVRLTGLDAAKFPRVRIRYRTGENSAMQLFWATSVGYSAQRALHVPVQGGEWQTVDVDLSAVPTWQGTMVGFRIDPPAAGMEIDEVKFLPAGGAAKP